MCEVKGPQAGAYSQKKSLKQENLPLLFEFLASTKLIHVDQRKLGHVACTDEGCNAADLAWGDGSRFQFNQTQVLLDKEMEICMSLAVNPSAPSSSTLQDTNCETLDKDTVCMKHCMPGLYTIVCLCLFSSCWPSRYHIGRSTGISNAIMTSSTCGAKGWSDHRFCVPPAYTAQLLTLHQNRANNQYRTANQILPTVKVSSNTWQHLNSLPSKC